MSSIDKLAGTTNQHDSKLVETDTKTAQKKRLILQHLTQKKSKKSIKTKLKISPEDK